MQTRRLACSVTVPLLIFLGTWEIVRGNDDPHPSEPGTIKELVPIELSTPDKLEYQFYPCSNGQIKFRIKAPNDAHIALTTSPHEGEPMYEVFIGGWKNQKSVIRKNRKKPDVSEADTPSILTNNDFRGFWIRWHDGKLTVGREGEPDPFLSYNDPEPFGIAYFGVCTGWGASGKWIIENPGSQAPSAPAKLVAGSSCRWCDVRDGKLPLDSVKGGSDHESVYVGRAWHNGAVIPGTVRPSILAFLCYVAWGGKGHGKNEYQVLCGCNPKWLATSGGNIPPNAIPGGKTEFNETLFVGRVNRQGMLTIGKVQPSHNVLYIPFGGAEVAFSDYEILVSE